MNLLFLRSKFRVDAGRGNPCCEISSPTLCEFTIGSPWGGTYDRLDIKYAISGKNPSEQHPGDLIAATKLTLKSFVKALQYAIDCPSDPEKTPPLWPAQREDVQEKLLQMLRPKEISDRPLQLILSNPDLARDRWTTVDLRADALEKAEVYVTKQAIRFYKLAL